MKVQLTSPVAAAGSILSVLCKLFPGFMLEAFGSFLAGWHSGAGSFENVGPGWPALAAGLFLPSFALRFSVSFWLDTVAVFSSPLCCRLARVARHFVLRHGTCALPVRFFISGHGLMRFCSHAICASRYMCAIIQMTIGLASS